MMDADTVFIVVNKNYRVSRNIRANWYFNTLNTTFKLEKQTNTQNIGTNNSAVSENCNESSNECNQASVEKTDEIPESWPTGKEFEIVAATPFSEDNIEQSFKLTEATDVRFLSLTYRFVFLIDMSPSMFAIWNSEGTRVSRAVLALEHILRSIAGPHCLPGTHYHFSPRIIASVILHSIDAAEVIVLGLDVDPNKLDDAMNDIKLRVNDYESHLAKCDILTKEYHKPNSEGALLNMIRHGVLGLSSLHPDNSTAGIIILTDCCFCTSEMVQLDRMLHMLRSKAIACSFVNVASVSNDVQISQYFGHVSYNELCSFISLASFGCYFQYEESTVQDSSNFDSAYCRLLSRSFNQLSRELQEMRISVQNSSLVYYEKEVPAPLMCVLSVRLREGYMVKRFTISKTTPAQISVELVLIWKPGVMLNYIMISKWPIDKNRCTKVRCIVEGEYSFIKDLLANKKLSGSSYCVNMVERFMFHCSQLISTDRFLEHLHSFNMNPVYFNVPDNHKSGQLSVFTADHDQITSDIANEQFAAYWKPIMQLDVNNCQKWMHTHCINIVLEHDSPIQTNISLPASNTRRCANVQCRQALAQVSNLLRQYCSFILLENHSYIKFMYHQETDEENNQPPIFFYLMRLDIKIPEVHIKLAFLAGTPGECRYSIVQSLKQSLSELTFPPRGKTADPKSRHKSGHVNKGNMDHVPPLQRSWPETPCCTVMSSAMDRLVVAFDPKTSLNNKTFELIASSQCLSQRMSLLLHQLKHYRRVSIVNNSDLCQISRPSVSKIFLSLINIRLQEGFHFAYTDAGFINMVQEVIFSSGSENSSYPCLVQYLLYPLCNKTRYDSDCSDSLSDFSTDLNSQSGVRIVTEVWVVPYAGYVMPPQPEIAHWSGRTCDGIAESLFEIDFDCIITYVTYERLKMTQLCNDIPNSKDYPPNCDYIESNITYVTSRSMELLLLFSFYKLCASIESIEQSAEDLLNLFYKEIVAKCYTKVDLSASEERDFMVQLLHRRNVDIGSITLQADNLPLWNCYVWKCKDPDHILIIMLPASFTSCTHPLVKDLCSPVTDVLPVFVYATSRLYLSFLLEDRWTYQKPPDHIIDFSGDKHVVVNDDYLAQTFQDAGKKNEKLTGELDKLRKHYIGHVRTIESSFTKSFVSGIYYSLQHNRLLHSDDIRKVIENLCIDLPPMMIDATEFLQTVCGHCFRPLQKIKMQALTQYEQDNPLHESDNYQMKIQLKSLKENACEVRQGFHSRIKIRINKFIAKYFKKIEGFDQYLYFSPLDSETKNIEPQPKIKDRFESAKEGSKCSGESIFQYYRQCSKEDRHFLEDVDEAPYVKGPSSYLDNDSDSISSNVDDDEDDYDKQPFFLHCTCSISYKNNLVHCSLSEIPTCIEMFTDQLLTLLKQHQDDLQKNDPNSDPQPPNSGDQYSPLSTEIDLKELHFTIDLIPLTYIDDEDNDEHGLNKTAEDDSSMNSDADSRRNSTTEGDFATTTQFSRIPEIRSCHILSPRQSSILKKCRDEMMWLLQDEIICALKYIPPVIESNIDSVVKHIENVRNHNLDPFMCQGIRLKSHSLKFVYGTENSMNKFIARFEKMPMQHTQCKLKKTGDYYYFIRFPSSRHEWDISAGPPEGMHLESVGYWDDYSTTGGICGPGSGVGTNVLSKMSRRSTLQSQQSVPQQANIPGDSQSIASRGDVESRHMSLASSQLTRCLSEGELPKKSPDDTFLQPRKSSACDPSSKENKRFFRSQSFQTVFPSSRCIQNVDAEGLDVEPELATIYTDQDQQATPVGSLGLQSSTVSTSQTLGILTSLGAASNNVFARRTAIGGLRRGNLSGASLGQDSSSTPRRHRSGESAYHVIHGVCATRSITPLHLDAFSHTNSSRGYEGDSSSVEGEFFGDFLSVFNESMLGTTCDMPNYWLIMRFSTSESCINIYFHHTDSHIPSNSSSTELPLLADSAQAECQDLPAAPVSGVGNLTKHQRCPYCNLFDRLIEEIQNIVKVVNQGMLLEKLSSTRKCSSLLVPLDDIDIQWDQTNTGRIRSGHSPDFHEDEDDDGPKLYDEMKFSPGTFACPVKRKMYYKLHPRLKLGNETGRRAIPTIRSVLKNFSVRERKNMFLMFDSQDASNVFYIIIHERSLTVRELREIAEENSSSEYMQGELLKMVEDEKQATSGIPKTPPCPSTDTDQDSAGPVTGNKDSSYTSPTVDVLEMLVHGIDSPSDDINSSFWNSMGSRLDGIILRQLSDNLSRNPMTRLTKEDVAFLQSYDHCHICQPPRRTFFLTLPPLAMDNPLAFCYYLKQNLLMWLISPKFGSPPPDNKFDMSAAGDTDSTCEVFLYNRNKAQGVSQHGVGVIGVQLVTGHSDKPLDIVGWKPPVVYAGDKLKFEDLVTMTQVNIYEDSATTSPDTSVASSGIKRRAKPGPTCLLRFLLWERGDADLDSLTDRLRLTAVQAVQDILMEFRLLTLPISELPDHLTNVYSKSVDSMPDMSPQTSTPLESDTHHRTSKAVSMTSNSQPKRHSQDNHQLSHSNTITNASTANLVDLPLAGGDNLHPRLLDSLPDFESGSKGNLNPFYSDVLVEWMAEACSKDDQLLYTSRSYPLELNLSMDQMLDELRRRMQDSVALNVFHSWPLASGRTAWIPWMATYARSSAPASTMGGDASASHSTRHQISPNSSPTKRRPGHKANYLLIGRHYEVWCHFISGRPYTGDDVLAGESHASFYVNSPTTPAPAPPPQTTTTSGTRTRHFTAQPSVRTPSGPPTFDSRKFRALQRQPAYEGCSFNTVSLSASHGSSSLGSGMAGLSNTNPFSGGPLSSSGTSSSSLAGTSSSSFPEFCCVSNLVQREASVPRQFLCIIKVEERKITSYCYNWAKDAQDNLDKTLTQLTEWNNTRFKILTGIIKQKMGLFHDLTSPRWLKVNDESRIHKYCRAKSPPTEVHSQNKSGISNRSSQRRGSVGSIQGTARTAALNKSVPFDRIFKDASVIPALVKSSADVVDLYAQQILKTKENESRRYKESQQLRTLMEIWQNSRPLVKQSTNETILDVLDRYSTVKRACRVVHAVSSPFLFSPDLRSQLREMCCAPPTPSEEVQPTSRDTQGRPVSAAAALHQNRLDPNRFTSSASGLARRTEGRSKTRHNSGNSGTSSRIFKHRSSSAVGGELEDGQGIPPLPMTSSTTDTNPKIEGGVPSPKMRSGGPSSPNIQGKFHTGPAPSSGDNNTTKTGPANSEEEKWMVDVRRHVMDEYSIYIQKELSFLLIPTPRPTVAHPCVNYALFRKCCYNSGIYILEVFVRGGFFCVRLGVIESARCTRRQQNIGDVVDEICKLSELTHVHSFMHDFHLRCIEEHLANRTSMFKSGFHVVRFLEDFIKLSPRPPCFSRNHVYLTDFCVSKSKVDQMQLFDYLHNREKTYGMKSARMEFVTSSGERIYEYCLYDHSQAGGGRPRARQVTSLDSLAAGNLAGVCESMEEEEEETVIMHRHREDSHDAAISWAQREYSVSFVLVRDSSLCEEGVLQFKFFVILTNPVSKFPVDKLIRRLDLQQTEASQTYVAVQPCILPTTSAQDNLIDRYTKTRSATDDIFYLLQDGAPIVVEKYNYLGQTVDHQIPVKELLRSQVRILKTKLIYLVNKAVSDGHKDFLWTRLYSDTLKAEEFQEIVETCGQIDLYQFHNLLSVAFHLALPHFDLLVQLATEHSSRLNPSSENAYRSACFHANGPPAVSRLVFFLPQFTEGFIMLTRREIEANGNRKASSRTGFHMLGVFREAEDLDVEDLKNQFLASPLVKLITDVVELCAYCVWKHLHT